MTDTLTSKKQYYMQVGEKNYYYEEKDVKEFIKKYDLKFLVDEYKKEKKLEFVGSISEDAFKFAIDKIRERAGGELV